MKDQSFSHSHRNSVSERKYPTSPERVFSAFVNTAKKRVQPSSIWVTWVETIATTIMMIGIFMWAGAFVSTGGAL
jgi:hypothetical protein